jgi:hypothetical protein
MTAAFMVVEIVAGIAFGSMALLADGVPYATHVGALGLAPGPIGWRAGMRPTGVSPSAQAIFGDLAGSRARSFSGSSHSALQ